MQYHPLASIATIPRERIFWSVLAALVGVQLLAFWLLCSHQVRKAEVRNATLQVQRVAVADCLRYVPRATLNSCASRVDPNSRLDDNAIMAGDAPGAARTAMSGTTAVNFSYR